MAKNDRPNVDEEIDGLNDRVSGVDLGKPSPIKRAVRKKSEKVAPALVNVGQDPAAVAEQQFLQRISTDLHARDRHGNPIPTLADRARKDGAAAYFRKGKPRVVRTKPKAEVNLGKK